MTFLPKSRRNFLKTLSTSTLISATSLPAMASSFDESQGDQNHVTDDIRGSDILEGRQTNLYDGPKSPLFNPVKISGNKLFASIASSDISNEMVKAMKFAPRENGTAWGIPFSLSNKILHLKKDIVSIEVSPFSGKWLTFLHTSDQLPPVQKEDGFYEGSFKGIGQLNEHIANYIIIYEDGKELSLAIKERYQIGMFQQVWGENCIEAVAQRKPSPLRAHHEQQEGEWGWSQTRVSNNDRGNWINWLWAWENPHPDKKIKGLRFEPLNKTSIILSAISVGNVQSNPLRWNSREKAVLTLAPEVEFDPKLDAYGLLSQIKIDLGQIISATPRLLYPNNEWTHTYNNKIPEKSKREIIIEYSAHPGAHFYLNDMDSISVSDIKNKRNGESIKVIPPANRRVKVLIFEKGSNKPIAVKFHAHGATDEYLPPVDRHRQPNNEWFGDYSVDFVHQNTHNCTYIPGETLINVPVGKVFIEVSKGFEIKPIRKVVNITAETSEMTIELERVLNWREKGWVTADTHVHFLSPSSAMLEGAAEGVNIVNLLASQWGELMTNVGDFDGKTTFGSKEAGGDGEYMVRVGTENRGHVMGHISLIGYEGNVIAPMTTGGVDESAIGDPIENLLTEWAQQCKKQDGIVVVPHFPNPRLENAASIVSGNIDGVEMTSWGRLYEGINPYSLTDWYRYLNCGYFVAAVGGTDKMSAGTAVGTVRTYAKIDDNKEFNYETWKEAIRKGHTFVTFGPLVDFLVDGLPSGSQIAMSANGGTVDITWNVASATVPMTKVELIVNGEVRESTSVSPWKGSGSWKLKIGKSSWVALLVRGHYENKPEIITAHTSPVMIMVKNSKMLAAADAITILEQIEGAMTHIESIGTRADEKTYKRMKMVLESAHRTLHNRMHSLGYDHIHTPSSDHREHHH